MKPPALVLPPGRCLTDVWDHLTRRERRPWLDAVQLEADGVALRAMHHRIRTRPATDVVVLLERLADERRQQERRSRELVEALHGCQVGRPRRAGWQPPDSTTSRR